MFSKKPALKEISPDELQLKLNRGEKITLIDVRGADEYEICHLEGAKLIPLKQIPNCLPELDPTNLTVLYCHYGMRSAQATLWLMQNGISNVANLTGGIDAWAQQIDPEMERY